MRGAGPRIYVSKILHHERATIKRWMRADQVQPRAYNNQNRIIVCMEKENK